MHSPNLLSNRLLRQILGWTAAFFVGAAMTPAALAQPDEADPPGRVGRIADLVGTVWQYTPETGDWVAAVRNRPLTTGDRLSTDAGGRAEVRIGSTTVRLDSGSEIEVQRLDDERMAFRLHNGSAAVRLRNREAAAEFELETDEGRFTVQRPGRFRFDREDATSHVTVDSGQALYEGPRNAVSVYSRQRAEVWIDADDKAQYSLTEPRRDEFATWVADRDRSDDRSVSARYVSPEMTGVEDLDRHGRWEQSDDYGPLWYPRVVVAGWAPYSTGHWAWVRPWGWTWVDDAPWGFAPFHYGRWVWHRSRWGWAPGTYVARPVYAPALVAWVGGPSLSVSVNIGGGFAGPAVGWFPLGPREVYVPGYRVSPRYVRNVNVTHVTNITYINKVVNVPEAQRDFRNRKFPHAVTVVPASVVTGRQSVTPVASRWRDAPEVREFVRESGRHGAFAAPPVAEPVAVVRGVDPRARRGEVPRPGFGNEAVVPPARQTLPTQPRDRDADRPGGTSRGAPGFSDGRGADGRGTDGRGSDNRRREVQPSAGNAPTVTSPGPAPAVVTAPVPSRQFPQPRPVPAAPSNGGNVVTPAPTMRGVPPAAPRQEGRAVERAPDIDTTLPMQGVPREAPVRGVPLPAPAPAGRAVERAPDIDTTLPMQGVPRSAPAERVSPDRRHHGQVTATQRPQVTQPPPQVVQPRPPQPQPQASVPPKAVPQAPTRAERGTVEDQPERRGPSPRDRQMMN